MADHEIDCASLSRGGAPITGYTEASTPPLSTADRYLVENNGNMSVFVETGPDPTTVTVEIPHTVDGQSVDPKTIGVAANSLVGIGGWPPRYYNNADAQIAISFSAVAGVKLFCSCPS